MSVCGRQSPSHSKGLGSRAWPLTAGSPLTSGLSQAWERPAGRGRVSGRTLSRLQGPGCGSCLVASGSSSFGFSRFSLCTEAAGGQPSRPAVLEDGLQDTGSAYGRCTEQASWTRLPWEPSATPAALCPAASVQETWTGLGHQPRTPHR